jgi:two-component system, sensor histidine kinase and response regulator
MAASKRPPNKQRNTVPGMGSVGRRLTVAGMGIGESFAMPRDAVSELARLRAELRRAEATIQGYLGMAHEIRTLISGMTGLSSMLLESELDEDQKHQVQLLRSSSTAMIDLVGNLLDWGKLESGTVEVEPVDTDPRRRIEEVADLCAARARDKKLHLVCTVDDDVPSTVSCDAVRLRQILLNFAANAIKYTDRGRILIRARCEPADETLAPGFERIRFEVVDTGRGVPSEARERIFEPFQQADAATAAKVGGTGLGLAISKGLVEAMGGRVGCEANDEGGSVFYASIPMRARRVRQRTSHGRIDLSDKTALVVDEDDATRAELVRMLGTLGIATKEAASAELAAALASEAAKREQPFDAVITGVVWAATDVASALESFGAGRGAKLVLLTYPDETLPASARGAIAVRVPRPVREAQLVGAVSGLFTALEEKAHGGRGSSKQDGKPKAPPTPTPNAGPAPAEPRAKVLLVEDDAVNAKVTTFMLQKRGLEVELALDALEAVEKTEAERYALVFMDLHTPRLDGIEATKRIREREGSSLRTPIVAMTAMAIDGTKAQCLAAGMDDYLSKPVSGEALDAMLARFELGQSPRASGTKSPGASRASASSRRAAPTKRKRLRPSPQAEAPRLDVEAFRTVASMGKPGSTAMARELVDMLSSALPKRIAELEEGSRGGDARRVERAAHSIKGMALQVGAMRLGKHASTLEQTASSGETRQNRGAHHARGSRGADRAQAALAGARGARRRVVRGSLAPRRMPRCRPHRRATTGCKSRRQSLRRARDLPCAPR